MKTRQSKKLDIEALISLEIQLIRQQFKYNKPEIKEKLKKVRELQMKCLDINK